MSARSAPEWDETPVVALDRELYGVSGEAYARLESILLQDPYLGAPQPDGRRRYLFRGLHVYYPVADTTDRTVVRVTGIRPPETESRVAMGAPVVKRLLDLALKLKGLLG